MEAHLARHVFSTLRHTLRETDVVGWYRHARVAAALLTEPGNASVADVSRRIHQRVTEAFDRRASHAPGHLQLRVYAVVRDPGAARELIVRGA